MNQISTRKENMSSLKYKIPLFDIDWTLLKGRNPAHRNASAYALHTVYNLPNASNDDIYVEGRIDSQILIEIAKFHGISEKEAENKVDVGMTTMVDYFMKHAEEGHYEVMPGVKELLEILKKLGSPMGLLTGNVEEIGWEKVKRAGIKDYFSFGAFGSMALKRVDLIPIAKKRAEKILKREIPLESLVIVGDSPLDIACARDGGLSVIAVGAGHYRTHELTHADLVVDSLEEKDKIIKFLGI